MFDSMGNGGRQRWCMVKSLNLLTEITNPRLTIKSTVNHLSKLEFLIKIICPLTKGNKGSVVKSFRLKSRLITWNSTKDIRSYACVSLIFMLFNYLEEK